MKKIVEASTLTQKNGCSCRSDSSFDAFSEPFHNDGASLVGCSTLEKIKTILLAICLRRCCCRCWESQIDIAVLAHRMPRWLLIAYRKRHLSLHSINFPSFNSKCEWNVAHTIENQFSPYNELTRCKHFRFRRTNILMAPVTQRENQFRCSLFSLFYSSADDALSMTACEHSRCPTWRLVSLDSSPPFPFCPKNIKFLNRIMFNLCIHCMFVSISFTIYTIMNKK